MTVGAKLDLRLIDETYGKRADLYRDVLKVPKTATSEEIQSAYYDRRTELFAVLGKIDAKTRRPPSAEQRRYLAEKKMDSVVFALRILGDPTLRKAYNKVRMERTGISSVPTAGSQTNGAAKAKGKTLKNQRQSFADPSSLDSKYLLQSSFSDSIFANLSSKDDSDEERNPRKSTRRPKQQPSSAKREEPVPKTEKRSIWGRKKKNKKKKQGKDALNDTMDTDTSMTDNEDEMNTLTDPSSIFVGVEPGSDSNTDTEFRRRGDDETRTYGDDETRTYRDDETRTYFDDETRTYFDDGESIVTDMVEHRGGPCGTDGVFGCISGSRAFRALANEVSGACEDTLTSVDQVFNAFTLTDNDIKAVTKKIERVEKQFFN